jgi:hypothetical protein
MRTVAMVEKRDDVYTHKRQTIVDKMRQFLHNVYCITASQDNNRLLLTVAMKSWIRTLM